MRPAQTHVRFCERKADSRKALTKPKVLCVRVRVRVRPVAKLSTDVGRLELALKK
jgi:hypothetical protein